MQNGINEWFLKSSLLGETATALERISGTVLGTGDMAFVQEGGMFYALRYNAEGTAATSSPSTIRPYDYASVGSGNWENSISPFGSQQVNRSIVNAEDRIFGGDATVSGNVITVAPYSCLDSTGVVQLFSDTGGTVTLPSEVSQDYFLFMVKTTAGDHEIRAYEAFTDVDSDTEVASSRFLDWWPTNSAGAARAGVLKGRIKWWSRFTENTINSLTDPPAGITTAINISTMVPVVLVEGVHFGGQASSAVQHVYLSAVSGTVQVGILAATTNLSSGGYQEWGSMDHQAGIFLPIMGDNVYWGEAGYTNEAGTCQLAIHAIKWRV